MEFSWHEMAFAILDESHTLACQALSNLAFEAVKANHPDDWKEKISCRFAASTREHVKRCLETNQPLTDIYAVCKIVQCFIHDVATFSEGLLSDAQEKERFSLHVQGIEAARNWVFHGELLSAEEVHSSIAILALILTTLKCGRGFVYKVIALLEIAEKLRSFSFNADGEDQCAVSALSVMRALLFRALVVFQEQFYDLFTTNQISFKEAQDFDGGTPKDISSLIKQIKAEINKPKKESLLVTNWKGSEKKVDKRCLFASLTKISIARNKLAHSGQLNASDIQEALHNIAHVLSEFGLPTEEPASALKRLSLIQGIHGRGSVVVVLKTVERRGILACGIERKHHILRPDSQPFVGRADEVSLMTTTMSSQSSSYVKVIAIFGPAGIGKSYMAAHLARILRNTHPRQVWLCCSGKREIQQDLHVNSHCFSSTLRKSNVQEQDGCLMVLDDVCSATVKLSLKIALRTGQDLMITTRSTVVKESIKRLLPMATVVSLQPFTPAESWELIKKKLGNVKLNNASFSFARSAASGVLGNLPLCVSIYSSMLAVVICRNPVGGVLDIESGSLLRNWREIEEQFGDRLHVRGIKGLIQSSERYLENHPFALFLLVKICGTNSENIPWDIIKENKQFNFSLGFWHIVNIPSVHTLYSELLGVLDYLFSDSGQRSLDLCRSDLEELGLVSWDSEASSIHIHRLTLSSLQYLLEERNFLGNLISLVVGHLVENNVVGVISKFLFQRLRVELLLQVIYKTVELLAGHEMVSTHNGNVRKEIHYNVYMILINITESNSCREILERGLSHSQLSDLFALIFHQVTISSHLLGMLDILNPFTPLTKLFDISHNHRNLSCVTDFKGFLLLHERGWEEAMAWLKKLVCMMGKYFNTDLTVICMAHVAFADVVQTLEGPLARKKYLKEVSQTCPRLLTEPNKDGIRNKLVDLQKNRSAACAMLLSFQDDALLLGKLIQFQIIDNYLENSTIDKTTQECGLLLISIFEERQNIILQEIQHHSTCTGYERMKEMNLIRALGTVTLTLSNLQCLLKKPGRLLKAMASLIEVLERKIPIFRDHLDTDDCLRSPWFIFTTIFQASCFLGSRYGLFSLANELSAIFDSLQDEIFSGWILPSPNPCGKNHVSQRFHDLVSGQMVCSKINEFPFTNCNEEKTHTNVTVLFFEGLSLLYYEKQFSSALTKFLMVLTGLSSLKAQLSSFGPVSYYRIVEEKAIENIVLVAGFMGKVTKAEVLQSLETFESDFRVPFFRKTPQTIAAVLGCIEQDSLMTNLRKYFAEARESFEKGIFRRAREASLKFWKEFINVIHYIPKSLEHKYRGIMELLLLQVAGYLWKCYSVEENYDTAEWFLKFCIQRAHDNTWHLHYAVHGVEYVEFLKDRKRWLDALEQCRRVERELVDEFGEDSIKWLPEAPNVGLLRASLEEEVRRQ